jgi:hypothetical protein
MWKICLSIIITVFSLLIGCATSNKQLYSWGDYPYTLYNYKKYPCEETLQQHKEVLLHIIESSEKNGLKVPPGVFCEYGYILLKEGNEVEALQYFAMEEKAYPESKVFIERLKLSMNQGYKDDSSI